MIAQLTLLLACQLVGEVVVRFLGVPLPGPVLGMVLLFVVFAARGRIGDPMQKTAGGLLEHLSLLFVPAGVGVMVYLPLIAAEWPAILTAVIASTLITIVVTAWTMAWLGRRTATPPDQSP